MKKVWMTAPLALSLSLVACGGGGNSGTAPVSAPGPQPAPVTSRVSGLLSFPGALPPVTGKAASGDTDATSLLADPLDLLSLKSWWLSPAEVLARQRQRGVRDDGIIPGEYIVRSRVGAAAALSTAQGMTAQGSPAILLAGSVTLQRTRELGLPGMALYRAEARAGVSALALNDVTRALATQPDVLSAEPNRWMHALATPNDKYFALQWDAQAMNLPAAWDTTKGKAVTVGVIDTGIVRHPDLLANTLPGLDLYADGSGKTFDLDPTDEGGGTEFHGSHVSGTVAAATNNALGIAGVSWGAKIVPVRVLGPQGGSLDSILVGILWAAGYDLTKQGLPLNKNPARVLNLSLGGSGACSPTEQEVFDYLGQQGVTAVIAAGNDNQDVANASPANCTGVIAVGATGPDGTRAPYSNFGARIDVMAPGGDSTQKIRIGGTELPGGILSTVADESAPGTFAYATLDGTSMAAPHVAGLVALLKGEQPDLTVAQVIARLKATSTPLSAAACRVTGGCGAGLVNAAAALKGAVAPGPSPTPPPAPPPAPPPPTPVGKVQTYVAALYSLPQGGFDANLSQIGVLAAKSLREGYQLSGLSAGAYQVAAWQDLNGDQEVSAGEPFGLYFNALTGKPGVTIDAVSRDIIGINVQLKPVTTLATGGPTPGTNLGALQRELEQQVKALADSRPVQP